MPDPGLASANKAIIQYLMEEIDRGNFAVIDECYDRQYVDRNPSAVRSLAPGIEGVKKAFAIFARAFPDTRHVIQDLVAEGDKVVARIWARGTHTGELMGIPPTGQVVEMTNIAIYRLAHGKIVERWAEQGLGVLEQLRLTPTDRDSTTSEYPET